MTALPGTPDLIQLESFAVELAHAAADATLPIFRSGCRAEDKAPGQAFDPVTEADRGAERAIRSRIAARFPDHGVLGEEYGADRDDAEWVWVLDPIDGTRAFIAGLPLWTTLIALRWRGAPVLGLIAQPVLGEIFIGGPHRAHLHDRHGQRQLAVRSCEGLGAAIASTTDPGLFKGAQAEAWAQLQAAVRLVRYGCDAYAYAMVAAGRMDLVVETGLKPWDYEALAPVIRGAGGQISNWRGEELDGSGQVVAAGDARVLDAAIPLLRRSAI